MHCALSLLSGRMGTLGVLVGDQAAITPGPNCYASLLTMSGRLRLWLFETPAIMQSLVCCLAHVNRWAVVDHVGPLSVTVKPQWQRILCVWVVWDACVCVTVCV